MSLSCLPRSTSSITHFLFLSQSQFPYLSTSCFLNFFMLLYNLVLETSLILLTTLKLLYLFCWKMFEDSKVSDNGVVNVHEDKANSFVDRSTHIYAHKLQRCEYHQCCWLNKEERSKSRMESQNSHHKRNISPVSQDYPSPPHELMDEETSRKAFEEKWFANPSSDTKFETSQAWKC